jgi:hypothetical protein
MSEEQDCAEILFDTVEKEKSDETKRGYSRWEHGIIRRLLKSHKNLDKLFLKAKMGTFLSLSGFQVSGRCQAG